MSKKRGHGLIYWLEDGKYYVSTILGNPSPIRRKKRKRRR